MFAEATLTQDELDLYYEVYHMLVEDAPVPDLVIYLQSTVEVMVKRIRSTGVPEMKIDKEYLQKISDGYTDFFYHYDASSLLIVNTTDMDFTSERGDYDMLLDYMDRLRPGRPLFQPAGIMTEKITIARLRGMKPAGEKIASLTAYDASFAGILDAAGG